MKWSPEENERWKRVGTAAAALVVGGAIVKIVREQGVSKAYVYVTERKNVFIGLLKDDGSRDEIAGTANERGEFIPDDIKLPRTALKEFENTFQNGESDDNNSLQNG